jgi:hypothetical protein
VLCEVSRELRRKEAREMGMTYEFLENIIKFRPLRKYTTSTGYYKASALQADQGNKLNKEA